MNISYEEIANNIVKDTGTLFYNRLQQIRGFKIVTGANLQVSQEFIDAAIASKDADDKLRELRELCETLDTPLFEHNCEMCVFLGQYRGQDLYFCSLSDWPTVIARWSSNPLDSMSGQSPTKAPRPMEEAIRRAKKIGLWKHITLNPKNDDR